MADNLTTQTSSLATIPTSTVIGTDEVSIGGVAQHVQRVKLVDGTNGGTDLIGGDATNGLDVDVTRLASVDIGALADAAIVTDTTGSLSGKLRGLIKWAFERMPASLGQKVKTASFPVVFASDQDTLAVSVASLPLPSGAATAANQATLITQTDGIEGLLTTIDADTGTLAGAVAGSEVQVDVLTLPAITGTVTANAGTGTFVTKETRASTATLSNVNDTASSTTLLASNANRLGATIFNDSTVDLYVKFGATASLTSFTVKLIPSAYFEVPFNYTGIIDGIWASDASGAARITEVTA